MTEETARKAANVILGAAAVAGAIYVVRTPPLRRLAWRVAVTALTGSIPAWLGKEIQAAWAATSPASDTPAERRRPEVTAPRSSAL